MKCKNMRVSFEIVPPIHKADRDGLHYTEDAVIEACKDGSGIPITAYNDRGERVIIGVVDSLAYRDGRISVDGFLQRGGLSEGVLQTYDLDLVTKCKFSSFSII